MRYLLLILLCSCSTTKTVIVDGSESEGHIVKYEWKMKDSNSNGIRATFQAKKGATIMLIVTDRVGLKDTATLKIE